MYLNDGRNVRRMVMHQPAALRAGFTLIEMMVVMAVIGVLRAIAVALYSQHVVRARSSDILVEYDAAQSWLKLRGLQTVSSRYHSGRSPIDSANLLQQSTSAVVHARTS
jgi:prepilin-type N-terminal cleavage/methylation domain-containing protein